MTQEDYDKMSLEELEKVIGINEEETKTEPVKEEMPATEEVKEEVAKEEVAEETQEEEIEDQSLKPFKGKTKKELIDIVKNNNEYVSKVQNDIYSLKKELEELRTKQVKSFTDEIKDKYSEEDLQVIEKIIENKLKQNEDLARSQKQIERDRNRQENENFYEELRKKDLDFVQNYEQDLIAEIKINPEKTLDSKNWVLAKYLELKNANKNVNNNLNNTVNKKDNTQKLQAKTIVSSAPHTLSVNKSVVEMTPDEYLEWASKNPEKAVQAYNT